MQNLHLYFSHPWLLLLLIPAFALTLIPYFRLSKRYRKTRNRIVSMVLHLIVITLAITVLSGIEFRYEIPNEKNEILLVVDMSDSETESSTARDEFVKTVLKDSKFDNFNVGVVTFGFNQVYAVPMTTDIDSIYNAYLTAALPDTTATNVEGALEYAQTLFKNPETGKIVLISDGKETDGSAISAARTVAAQGIKIDTAFIESSYEGDDVQLVEVTLPDYHVGVNEECEIILTLKSTAETAAVLTLHDNGTPDTASSQTVEIPVGTKSVSFAHTFESEGLHELYFTMDISDDALQQNNTYTSYLYLEQFNNVLVIERASGESTALAEMLNTNLPEEEQYEITIKTIGDTEIPNTLDGLRKYDQIILNNISNDELTSIDTLDEEETFDLLLRRYVEEVGGGLFTVGGNNEDGEANAYNRADMYATEYQKLLPVEAINYTPPVGVVIIIDRSGSMTSQDDYGETYFEGAKAGAIECLQALSERDYVGIMTLDSVQSTILPLTPRTQDTKIREAIDSLENADGNTIFYDAIDRAGQALTSLKVVDKRHIIIVTDGGASDTPENYEALIAAYYEKGITLSVVGVGLIEGSMAAQAMQRAVDLGHGQLHYTRKAADLVDKMREDLNAPTIKEVNDEPFRPTIYNMTSPLVSGLEKWEDSHNKLTMELGGFYGVKVRSTADLVLVGEYDVPIYAQWKFGAGMVGSFMCDLQKSDWSSDFMEDVNGQKFIQGVVKNLMPTESIRSSDLIYKLREDNYTNQLSVYPRLGEGEYVKGELVQITDAGEKVISLNEVKAPAEGDTFYVTLALNAENRYSRCDFIVKQSGVYRLTLSKCDAQGNVISTVTTHKAFAYSEEYDVFLEVTNDELRANMNDIAKKGNGSGIDDLENPVEIFADFITEIARSFDPRTLFMIIAIVLFLIDIAVRKFKFKWPHEIIRDYKNRKSK